MYLEEFLKEQRRRLKEFELSNIEVAGPHTPIMNYEAWLASYQAWQTEFNYYDFPEK